MNLGCVEEFCSRAKKEYEVILKDKLIRDNHQSNNRILVLEDNRIKSEEKKLDLKGILERKQYY